MQLLGSQTDMATIRLRGLSRLAERGAFWKPRVPPVRFLGLERCMSIRPPAVGLPTGGEGAVSISAAPFRVDRPPHSCECGFILRSRCLFGVPSPTSRPRLSVRPACQGFVPLRGITYGVHCRGSSPTSATVRPRVFSTSRRFSPPFGFAGLFHPAATSRVLRSGASPAPQPYRLVAGRASLPLSPDRSPASRLPRSNESTSRRFPRNGACEKDGV